MASALLCWLYTCTEGITGHTGSTRLSSHNGPMHSQQHHWHRASTATTCALQSPAHPARPRGRNNSHRHHSAQRVSRHIVCEPARDHKEACKHHHHQATAA